MAKSKDHYSKKEAASRFEAALRGARLAQPQPLKDVPRKRAQTKNAKKRT